LDRRLSLQRPIDLGTVRFPRRYFPYVRNFLLTKRPKAKDSPERRSLKNYTSADFFTTIPYSGAQARSLPVEVGLP